MGIFYTFSKIRMVVSLFITAVVFLLVVIFVLPSILNERTHEIEFTVLLVDAPTHCNSSTRYGGRDSKPKFGFAGKCGYVHTDEGMFKIVQSRLFGRWDDKRKRVVEQLHFGCKYRAKVRGPKDTPLPKWKGMSNRPTHRIFEIIEKLECDPDAVELNPTAPLNR